MKTNFRYNTYVSNKCTRLSLKNHVTINVLLIGLGLDNNSYSFALNKKCNLDLFTLALSVGALFTQAKVLDQYF